MRPIADEAGVGFPPAAAGSVPPDEMTQRLIIWQLLNGNFLLSTTFSATATGLCLRGRLPPRWAASTWSTHLSSGTEPTGLGPRGPGALRSESRGAVLLGSPQGRSPRTPAPREMSGPRSDQRNATLPEGAIPAPPAHGLRPSGCDQGRVGATPSP